jgi:hypothetical protein
MNEFITTLSAILTPIVAVTGTILAIQQWKLSDRKLRHDLYERRLEIYMALTSLFATVEIEANVTHEERLKFSVKTRESHFLFSDKIKVYLEEVFKAAVEVHTQFKMLDLNWAERPQGEERKKIIDENGKRLKWFSAQREIAREKFSREMGLA